MSKLTVSRRSYLLSRPSANLMRAAGVASASGAERARQDRLKAHHAQVLRNAGVSEGEIGRTTIVAA